MANKNTSSSDDIKVGVSVVQPTKEKLTLLESIKMKVPKKVKGPKIAKKEKVSKTEKTIKSTTKKSTVKATKPKATKSVEKDIEVEL